MERRSNEVSVRRFGSGRCTTMKRKERNPTTKRSAGRLAPRTHREEIEMAHHIGYIHGQSASRSPRRNSVGAGPGSRNTPTTFRPRGPGRSRGRTTPPSNGGECQRRRTFVTLRNAAIHQSVDRKTHPSDASGSTLLPTHFWFPGSIVIPIEKNPQPQGPRAKRKRRR